MLLHEKCSMVPARFTEWPSTFQFKVSNTFNAYWCLEFSMITVIGHVKAAAVTLDTKNCSAVAAN